MRMFRRNRQVEVYSEPLSMIQNIRHDIADMAEQLKELLEQNKELHNIIKEKDEQIKSYLDHLIGVRSITPGPLPNGAMQSKQDEQAKQRILDRLAKSKQNATGTPKLP